MEVRGQISKNKKKHTLVPLERYLVWKFERDISILSIVCTLYKIGVEIFACVPPPLLSSPNSNPLFILYFNLTFILLASLKYKIDLNNKNNFPSILFKD